MKTKKVNPRRIPASQSDVIKARNKASDDAVRLTLAIVLTVLFDKHGFDKEQIQALWKELEKLSEEVDEGRVNAWDLKNVLETEYEVILS